MNEIYSVVNMSMLSLFWYGTCLLLANLFVDGLVRDVIRQQEEGPKAASWKRAYCNIPQWSRTYFWKQIDSLPVLVHWDDSSRAVTIAWLTVHVKILSVIVGAAVVALEDFPNQYKNKRQNTHKDTQLEQCLPNRARSLIPALKQPRSPLEQTQSTPTLAQTHVYTDKKQQSTHPNRA